MSTAFEVFALLVALLGVSALGDVARAIVALAEVQAEIHNAQRRKDGGA